MQFCALAFAPLAVGHTSAVGMQGVMRVPSHSAMLTVWCEHVGRHSKTTIKATKVLHCRCKEKFWNVCRLLALVRHPLQRCEPIAKSVAGVGLTFRFTGSKPSLGVNLGLARCVVYLVDAEDKQRVKDTIERHSMQYCTHLTVSFDCGLLACIAMSVIWLNHSSHPLLTVALCMWTS
eukprot:4638858-Amphidinium_carterae.1